MGWIGLRGWRVGLRVVCVVSAKSVGEGAISAGGVVEWRLVEGFAVAASVEVSC